MDKSTVQKRKTVMDDGVELEDRNVRIAINETASTARKKRCESRGSATDDETGSSEEEDAALADSDSNDDSDLEYEVEKIVNRRVKPGTSLRYRCIHAAAVSE